MTKYSHATQMLNGIEDIKNSPIHGLSIVEITKFFKKNEIETPIKYIEGKKCPDCLLYYAKDIVIDNQNLKVIFSRGALRIYSK